jgi:siderophore synthetase component
VTLASEAAATESPADVPADTVPADTGAAAHRGAADRLASEALLRCWIRERGVPRPAGDALDLDLGSSTLRVPVEYWSPTGMHRLGRPASALAGMSPGGLARLLGETVGASGENVEELVRHVTESSERIAGHLAARAAQPDPAVPATPFLTAEQGLLAGDPLHPAPKSRDALSGGEAARYSPELRGSFPLHWFAVTPELAAHDSELGPGAPDLAAFLSGLTPDGRVLVPAHPWQACELLRRPEVRALIDAGKLAHLGAAGAPWHPTSSLRTVYRADCPVMLKLSLAPRITGSRRENPREELLRGIEAHRLLSGELGAQLLTAHPGFRVLTDAGYLAVDGVPGLDALFRHSPFRAADHVFCVAALTDLGRGAVARDGHPHELAAHLHSLAAVEQRPVRAVAMEWFARYVMTLITPLLWLDAEHGVTLAAHQRNTLIQLDGAGYPGAGWYRGNRGLRYRASRIGHLEAVSGIHALGRAAGSIADDDLATRRLLYHVGINNLMGLAGALGCAGVAEERELLGVAADLLGPLRGHRPVDLLLGAKTLPCQANLLTRAAAAREPAGEPAARSVHVEIANPFAALGGGAS